MRLRKSALGHADSNAGADLEDLIDLLPHAEVKRVRGIVAERLVYLRMHAASRAHEIIESTREHMRSCMAWAHKHKLLIKTSSTSAHTYKPYEMSAYMQQIPKCKHDVCTLKDSVLVLQLVRLRWGGCRPG